jgi:cysteinyl-tRNA synthetase
MLTVNGQKMSKSLGNSFLPRELFAGDHKLLERGYSPMTVRFFMLQSHYSSTLDFSNDALNAADKAYKKLANSLAIVKKLEHAGSKTVDETLVNELKQMVRDAYTAMSDDFNTAKAIATLFEMSARINSLKAGTISVNALDAATFEQFKSTYIAMVENVLGLKEETESNSGALTKVIDVVIGLRKKVRADRNYALSDKIRDDLQAAGVQLKDGKDGEISYTIE